MKQAKAGVSVIYGGVPREMAWHLFKKKKKIQTLNSSTSF